MKTIKANHYSESIIYALELTIRNIKYEINQYVMSILTDITPEQFFVLDTIYTHNNCCQKDICELLSKDKSNVNRIVEILEDKCFIRKIAGKKTNRLVNYIEITESGKSLVETNIPHIKTYMQNLFQKITDEEIDTLNTIISKLSSHPMTIKYIE